MRKVIATMNMTLDGFCDHTAMVADEEIHQYYSDLLRDSGALIYGRVTYKLMADYWPAVVVNPTGNKPMDEFAMRIENIPKVVFSRTLKEAGWKNATLARRSVEDEVMALKRQPGADILVGSPGLILATMRLGLVDEYRICVHPVVAGGGLPLFKQVDKTLLRLLETRRFKSGAILLCYEPLIG